MLTIVSLPARDDAAITGLISLFLADSESGVDGNSGRFFEVLQWLGPERELAAVLQTLERCGNRDVIRLIAERLLRLVFDDERVEGSKNRGAGSPACNADEDAEKSKIKILAADKHG